MQKPLTGKRFAAVTRRLLVSSALLLLVSSLLNLRGTDDRRLHSLAAFESARIRSAENKFQKRTEFFADLFQSGATTISESERQQMLSWPEDLFVYDASGRLLFWNSSEVLPPSELQGITAEVGAVHLPNGWYFFQKARIAQHTFICLTLIQHDYFVTNNYLKNNFAGAEQYGESFGVNTVHAGVDVKSPAGEYLFSIRNTAASGAAPMSMLAALLRVLALLPLFYLLQFGTVVVRRRRGLWNSFFFLLAGMLLLRVLTYISFFRAALRTFRLFDPSVYGSGLVLRSLGDLLINGALLFWLVYYVRLRLKHKPAILPPANNNTNYIRMLIGAFVVLIGTGLAIGAIRSLVADSQISFDVLNFFSLDIFSVIGFLFLCCVAGTYYYFCRVILAVLEPIVRENRWLFLLMLTAGGLLLLSFRIGSLHDGFELYALLWLLLLVFLLRMEINGAFKRGFVVSRLVFWLFFFSISIASLLTGENSNKELQRRRHFAELLAARTNSEGEGLLNSILTEFRPDMLATEFSKLTESPTAGAFRDSLINRNFRGYTDRYDTKVLVYDTAGRPLNNNDDISYNTLNSIIRTQARPSVTEGLYNYDAGGGRFSFIAPKKIQMPGGEVVGYLFILITPRDVENATLYPALFSRDDDEGSGNASGYGYAVYDHGELISSYNDYAFSSRYPEHFFAGKQFLLDDAGGYSELWFDAGNQKYVVVVRETHTGLEWITLFSYLFCAFLLASGIFRLAGFLFRSGANLRKIRGGFQFSIRRQVHGTVIFFSAVSFLIIGVATILFFIQRYRNNDREQLNRTARVIQNVLGTQLSAQALDTINFQRSESAPESALQKTVSGLSATHGTDINLYDTSGNLKASSLPLPYVKGMLSQKIDPVAYDHLAVVHEIQFYQKERIGTLDFMSEYVPVTDSSGRSAAYLNLPYFSSQSRLRQEISDFLVTIINLNAFIFLIAGIAALLITNRITSSFLQIGEKMKNISLGEHIDRIEWPRNDEIGLLVTEYNRMLAKLEESAAALTRSEREYAWQEMAKQVAHEIKNPLTPMKLSMQFLQRAIEEDRPGIKELSKNVSETLVQQIDHLSRIAGDFSRFADIEKAAPERFDVYAMLRSLTDLYRSDTRISFGWQIPVGSAFVNADKSHINRVITNILLNAMQSGGDAHVQVALTARTEGKEVLITISDNGSGIPDALREKIFAPNFTTKTSGTGLGLAMSKRMIENAGGGISFDSSDSGTSFHLRLPLTG